MDRIDHSTGKLDSTYYMAGAEDENADATFDVGGEGTADSDNEVGADESILNFKFDLSFVELKMGIFNLFFFICTFFFFQNDADGSETEAVWSDIDVNLPQ